MLKQALTPLHLCRWAIAAGLVSLAALVYYNLLLSGIFLGGLRAV